MIRVVSLAVEIVLGFGNRVVVGSVRGLVFGFAAVEVVSGWDTIGSVLVW